jgi:18S rRNA (guanine1575-N7)-methyltransferase
MSRPEDLLYVPITALTFQTNLSYSPPDLYYNDTESAKYTTSSRIQNIQASMTHRALELLHLPSTYPSLILDIGCGSGLSGAILSSEEHIWAGLDISPSMLDIALQKEDVDGDLFLADMGQGLPFRAGTFDAAISISAVQWLCNAETSGVSPEGRLRRFFDGLYACLRRGGRAVLQFYPKNLQQREMITTAAIRAGFGAGVLEDDPGTKNAKLYLVLSAGGGDITGAVNGMEDVDVEDSRKAAREVNGMGKRKRGEMVKGSKKWIVMKKEKMKNKGKIVKPDSKYTGRRRGPKF